MEGIGLYEVTKKTTVKNGYERNSKQMKIIKPGEIVNVVETRIHEERVRARLAIGGWITLTNLKTNVAFAKSVNAPSEPKRTPEESHDSPFDSDSDQETSFKRSPRTNLEDPFAVTGEDDFDPFLDVPANKPLGQRKHSKSLDDLFASPPSPVATAYKPKAKPKSFANARPRQMQPLASTNPFAKSVPQSTPLQPTKITPSTNPFRKAQKTTTNPFFSPSSTNPFSESPKTVASTNLVADVTELERNFSEPPQPTIKEMESDSDSDSESSDDSLVMPIRKKPSPKNSVDDDLDIDSLFGNFESEKPKQRKPEKSYEFLKSKVVKANIFDDDSDSDDFFLFPNKKDKQPSVFLRKDAIEEELNEKRKEEAERLAKEAEEESANSEDKKVEENQPEPSTAKMEKSEREPSPAKIVEPKKEVVEEMKDDLSERENTREIPQKRYVEKSDSYRDRSPIRRKRRREFQNEYVLVYCHDKQFRFRRDGFRGCKIVENREEIVVNMFPRMLSYLLQYFSSGVFKGFNSAVCRQTLEAALRELEFPQEEVPNVLEDWFNNLLHDKEASCEVMTMLRRNGFPMRLARNLMDPGRRLRGALRLDILQDLSFSYRKVSKERTILTVWDNTLKELQYVFMEFGTWQDVPIYANPDGSRLLILDLCKTSGLGVSLVSSGCKENECRFVVRSYRALYNPDQAGLETYDHLVLPRSLVLAERPERGYVSQYGEVGRWERRGGGLTEPVELDWTIDFHMEKDTFHEVVKTKRILANMDDIREMIYQFSFVSGDSFSWFPPIH